MKAQNTYYLNQENAPVSLANFNKLVTENNCGWAYQKTDTAIFIRLSKNYYQGKLPSSYLKQIRTTLESYSSKGLDSNSLFFISYYTGIEHKIIPGYRYLKPNDHHLKTHDIYIKSLGNVKYFNIYSKDLHPDSAYTFYNNYQDKEDVFSKFFELQYPLISSIIIRPDGKYVVLFGITVNAIDEFKVIKEMLKPSYIAIN